MCKGFARDFAKMKAYCARELHNKHAMLDIPMMGYQCSSIPPKAKCLVWNLSMDNLSVGLMKVTVGLA